MLEGEEEGFQLSYFSLPLALIALLLLSLLPRVVESRETVAVAAMKEAAP